MITMLQCNCEFQHRKSQEDRRTVAQINQGNRTENGESTEIHITIYTNPETRTRATQVPDLPSPSRTVPPCVLSPGEKID